MTAAIIDLAACRAERDAHLSGDNEIIGYFMRQPQGAETLQVGVNLKSGRQQVIAVNLSWADAYEIFCEISGCNLDSKSEDRPRAAL